MSVEAHGRDGDGASLAGRLTVVLLTHNCAAWLEPILQRLVGLDVPIIAVDNASTDATRELLGRHPQIEVVALDRNIGAAGRNVGCERARTPYVAFCDDDGWYERAGLEIAADLLDQHPLLALVNAHIVVHEEERVDPISVEMAASPLPDEHGLPGTVLLGFMGGAVVFRRSAYLQVGGYDPRFFIGGEEETLAFKLAKVGWQMRYVPDVVMHHEASGVNGPRIRHFGVRNTLVNAWLHRPFRSAVRWTWFIVATTPLNRGLLRGVGMAVAALPWIIRERRPMSAELDRALTVLDDRRMASTPSRFRSAESVW